MKLEYYVLRHEFNSDTIEKHNIFNNGYVDERLEDLLKNFVTLEDFKEKLDKLFIYCYAHKVEYEVIVSGVVCKYDNQFKISIYDQIKPNLDLIARYIIEQWNNRPYARKRIEI